MTPPDPLDRSEHDLLLELGQALFGADEHLSGADLEDLVGRAREWVTTWSQRHRRVLCQKLQDERASGKDPLTTLLEASALADAAVQLGLDTFTGTIIGAVLVKWGVDSLCRDT